MKWLKSIDNDVLLGLGAVTFFVGFCTLFYGHILLAVCAMFVGASVFVVGAVIEERQKKERFVRCHVCGHMYVPAATQTHSLPAPSATPDDDGWRTIPETNDRSNP
jgi:uncharacterized membrane protein YjjP (DUF1212 family)